MSADEKQKLIGDLKAEYEQKKTDYDFVDVRLKRTAETLIWLGNAILNDESFTGHPDHDPLLDAASRDLIQRRELRRRIAELRDDLQRLGVHVT